MKPAHNFWLFFFPHKSYTWVVCGSVLVPTGVQSVAPYRQGSCELMLNWRNLPHNDVIYTRVSNALSLHPHVSHLMVFLEKSVWLRVGTTTVSILSQHTIKSHQHVWRVCVCVFFFFFLSFFLSSYLFFLFFSLFLFIFLLQPLISPTDAHTLVKANLLRTHTHTHTQFLYQHGFTRVRHGNWSNASRKQCWTITRHKNHIIHFFNRALPILNEFQFSQEDCPQNAVQSSALSRTALGAGSTRGRPMVWSDEIWKTPLCNCRSPNVVGFINRGASLGVHTKFEINTSCPQEVHKTSCPQEKFHYQLHWQIRSELHVHSSSQHSTISRRSDRNVNFMRLRLEVEGPTESGLNLIIVMTQILVYARSWFLMLVLL